MLPRDLRDSIGDLVKGTVPLELGLQAPGMGTADRISGHGAGGGADAGPGGFAGGAAERGAGPGQAGGDFSFVFALPGDDERDAVGERLPAGALAAVRPPWEVRTSSMLFSPPGACAVTRVTRTLLPAGRRRERRGGGRHCESGSAAVLSAGASRAGSRRGGCLPARDRGGRAGPRQSSAGCQSTGGGSEPCLMMLAYTLSSASLSGPTRPSGSPPKNRRRTRSTCPGAASS